MADDRAKYVQAGTGQVGCLYYDSLRGAWVFALFAGGPVTLREHATWDDPLEADAELRKAGFVQAEE